MKQLNWWKSIASFLVVLFTMPLGHALMMIMDKTMTPEAVHYSAFFMGLAGLIMVVIGVFVKGDTKQTLWGHSRQAACYKQEWPRLNRPSRPQLQGQSGGHQLHHSC